MAKPARREVSTKRSREQPDPVADDDDTFFVGRVGDSPRLVVRGDVKKALATIAKQQAKQKKAAQKVTQRKTKVGTVTVSEDDEDQDLEAAKPAPKEPQTPSKMGDQDTPQGDSSDEGDAGQGTLRGDSNDDESEESSSEYGA